MTRKPQGHGLKTGRSLVGRRWTTWCHGDRLIAWAAATALVLLILVPIGMLLFASVRGPVGALPTQARAYFSFEHYVEALLRVSSWRMVLETGAYVLGAVAVSLLFAVSLAWLTERTRIPKPNLWAAFVVLPFLLPPSLITGTWMSFLRPRSGSINVFLRENLFSGFTSGPLDTANIPAMVLGQSLFLVPITYLVIAGGLRNINGTTGEMSLASGASPMTTLRRVTLPLLFPSLFTAAVLGAWFTMDWTDVPFDLGAIGSVRLLSVRIYFQTVGSVGGFPNFGGAAAHAVLTMFVLGGLFMVYARWTRHGAKYAAAGTAGGRPMRSPASWWMLPMMALAAFYGLTMWLAPMYRLLNSVVAGGAEAFEAVLASSRFWAVSLNTLIVAVGSATLGTLVVVLVTWVVVRSESRVLRRPLDVLATAPLVVPGLLAASAFLLTFLVLDWLSLWGTHMGLIIALTYRLAVPYRLTNAGMRQITRDMDDASAASGAGPITTIRRVLLPMLAPTIASSWIIFFVFAVRERSIVEYVGYQVRTFTTIGRFSSTPGAPEVASLLALVMFVAIIALVRYLLVSRTAYRRLSG